MVKHHHNTVTQMTKNTRRPILTITVQSPRWPEDQEYAQVHSTRSALQWKPPRTQSISPEETPALKNIFRDEDVRTMNSAARYLKDRIHTLQMDMGHSNVFTFKFHLYCFYFCDLGKPFKLYWASLVALTEESPTMQGWIPGESHGQRSLAGYSLWGHKELDTTEQLIVLIFFSLSFLTCKAMRGAPI